MGDRLRRKKLDVGAYLTSYHRIYKVRKYSNGTLYNLRECVFNPSHGKYSATIFQEPGSGVLSYHCLNDTCEHRDWLQARNQISGDDSLAAFYFNHDPSCENPPEPGEEEVDKPLGSYANAGLSIGQMVDKKQAAYGDSFGRAGAVLREMHPDGIRPDQFDDMLTVIRIIDKLFRIATDKDAFGENPFSDIAGYGILGAGSRSSDSNEKIILSHMNSVTDYIKENLELKDDRKVLIRDLYNDYREWCAMSGYKHTPAYHFIYKILDELPGAFRVVAPDDKSNSFIAGVGLKNNNFQQERGD